MAAPAQAPRQAEPMRGTVTSGLPRAFTTPTTHSARLGHKAPLSPGQKTQHCLSPQKYNKGHRKKAPWGQTAWAYGPLGERGFTSSKRVAHAWPEGPFILSDRGPFCVLFSHLVLRQSLPI